jgi:hypothetical protein
MATGYRLLSQYRSGEQASRLGFSTSAWRISSKTWLGHVSNIWIVSDLMGWKRNWPVPLLLWSTKPFVTLAVQLPIVVLADPTK